MSSLAMKVGREEERHLVAQACCPLAVEVRDGVCVVLLVWWCV